MDCLLLSPLEMKILVHCHKTDDMVPCHKTNKVKNALEKLLQNNLIQAIDGSGFHFQTTQSGSEVVEQILILEKENK